MNINLHIENLLIDGLDIPHGQRLALIKALESELSRLLTENGLGETWHAGGSVPALKAANIQVNPGSPTQLGASIARSVYTGLNPQSKPSTGPKSQG